jgi:hypothetical protein
VVDVAVNGVNGDNAAIAPERSRSPRATDENVSSNAITNA